ncbi:MAG: fused response regulator/phosphatase [Desulfamplus sp.]|nr:fused response regulator/phosphatase [Desulfamplus sp.]
MKALIVDDDMSNRLLFKILLEQDGCVVYTAQNGIEGVEMFKSINPDIILMDVMMPLMDGYEATRAIKAHAGEHFVPVIVLTALNDPEDIAKAIECGADDFISKPVNSMILKAKMVAMERLRLLYNNLNLQKIELERTNTELELLNNKMRQEQDAAGNLFQKVLKINEQKCTNVKQILLPMETFSGDIVFSRAKSSGGQYLLVGDFAGHGLLAAIGTLPVSEVFNNMADTDQPVCGFVFQINKRLKELLPPSVFLCASILEINLSEQLMTVWSGGMPDIFVVGKNGGIKNRIKSSNLPLGVLKNERLKCETETLKFDHEDCIYIFSDGVTETFNEQNEMYGQKRLEEHFIKVDAEPDVSKEIDKGSLVDRKGSLLDSYDEKYDPNTILDKIKKSLDDFRGNLTQRDDITIVQIRCGVDSATVCYFD